MRSWALLLAGLCVWAAHFFGLYAIASALPGKPELASWFVVGVTALAITANLLILRWTLPKIAASDQTDNWVARLAAAGAAISLLSVVWQVTPVLFV